MDAESFPAKALMAISDGSEGSFIFLRVGEKSIREVRIPEYCHYPHFVGNLAVSEALTIPQNCLSRPLF